MENNGRIIVTCYYCSASRDIDEMDRIREKVDGCTKLVYKCSYDKCSKLEEKTSDAVKILHNRYIKGDPEREKSLEDERDIIEINRSSLEAIASSMCPNCYYIYYQLIGRSIENFQK